MDEFLGYIVTETAKAFLFQCHYWHAAEWLPKSQIRMTRFSETDEVKVIPAQWLVRKNGWSENKELKNVSN